jgi:hypothetical protein
MTADDRGTTVDLAAATGGKSGAGAMQDAARLLGFADVDAPARAKSWITASVIAAESYVGMGAEFAALAARSDSANPFMSPACVAAARQRFPGAELLVLAARDSLKPGAPLTGVWVLRATRDLWSLGARVLQAPLEPGYDALSTPVLDRAAARASLHALIDLVKNHDGVSRVVRAGSFAVADGPALPAFARLTVAERWERAVLRPPAGIACEDYLAAAMGGGLKKRNAQARALAREGEVAITASRRGQAVDAFERFIALEARGWKGAAGTALARMPADAAYMRACVRAFADADQVSLDEITLDGAPVAAGLIVEAAGYNVFWKTAFDERWRRCSPGVLLDMAVTRRLFAEGRPSLDSGMMEFTDPDGQVWSERLELARACIDFGAGFAGLAARAGKRARHALRLAHRRVRSV